MQEASAPGNTKHVMKITGIFGSILVSWLFWISKAVVKLETDVAVIKYKLFDKVSEAPKPEKEVIESGMNLFQFLERLK